MSATVQQLVSALIDRIYPIGSIVCFSKDVDPNASIGGGWTQIKDCFLLASGSKALGSKGGSETHTMSVSEMPAHTHTRGTMEIAGKVTYITADSGNISSTDYPTTGAFRWLNEGFTARAVTTTGTGSRDLDFAASRSWTGSTSSTGGGQPFSIMPPYRTVNVWERTS